jgi:signal transduction histidine kinase
LDNIAIPHETIAFFRKQLELEDGALKIFEPYRSLFTKRKNEFSQYFYDYFSGIPETKIILEHERKPGNLQKSWAHWFETLFRLKWDDRFFAYLWRSGLRHVEVNLDQRFVNLGYFVVKKYCHDVIEAEISFDERETVLWIIDKMLDMCLLIETHAYISATSKCDREVVRGVAHQLRNPITIIGGNIKRLQDKLDEGSPIHRTYDAIIRESKRLERLVTDIAIYTEVFQEDPEFKIASLKVLISHALEDLFQKERNENIKLEIDLDPSCPYVYGDPKYIKILFYYLLENSMEAVGLDNPCIRISSAPKDDGSNFISVEIFNTGIPPKIEDIQNLYAPFFSSKPTGTGFGLPIARLAAWKNLGNFALVPVPGQGTKCFVTLPVPS